MSATAATKTRYPGFMAALFLVALRIAIGWHFLYEGMDKLHSFQTAKPFSAEAYLRFANGPLADHFRAIVPDVDSTAFLDLDQRPVAWKTRLGEYSAHYGLTPDQISASEKSYETALAKLDAWRKDRENHESLDKYKQELATNEALLSNPGSMSYERERAQAKRKDLDGDRRKLVSAVQALEDEIYTGLDKSLTPEQKAKGAVPKKWSELDWVNHLTAWGLTLSGASLMLGFLAPLGALGGAYLLTMFYLAMPPFPGLPANPMSEGHYLIVNKNVVEFLACIALVFIPTSMWVGLDAVLFGPWLRARRARRQAAAAAAE
jgi:uncharacterized membrane protein YphA (DoxX/SURF4 family)